MQGVVYSRIVNRRSDMAHERTHTGSELDEKGVVQSISTQISYESSVRIGVKREDDGNVQLTIGRAEPVGAFSGLDAAVALTKAEARHIAELLSPLVPENVHQGATASENPARRSRLGAAGTGAGFGTLGALGGLSTGA